MIYQIVLIQGMEYFCDIPKITNWQKLPVFESASFNCHNKFTCNTTC